MWSQKRADCRPGPFRLQSVTLSGPSTVSVFGEKPTLAVAALAMVGVTRKPCVSAASAFPPHRLQEWWDTGLSPHHLYHTQLGTAHDVGRAAHTICLTA